VLRRLFTAAAALSLLLCAATAVLWVRSYWRLDIIANPRSSVPQKQLRTQLFGWCYRGECCVMIVRQRGDYYGDRPWRTFSGREAEATDDWLHGVLTATPGTWHGFVGFSFGGQASQDGAYYRFLRVPLWSMVCVLAILPALAIHKNVRRKVRSTRMRCLACGYDLRSSPNRCPECGRSAVRNRHSIV
jgi:hypothetical protein